LTPVGRGSALISWSGSMFEYLMPSLVMRAPAGSLLEQTSRLVVARQIRYGNERSVPWGISESGYNARDLMQAGQRLAAVGQCLEQFLGAIFIDQHHAALGDAMGQQEAVIHRGDDVDNGIAQAGHVILLLCHVNPARSEVPAYTRGAS